MRTDAMDTIEHKGNGTGEPVEEQPCCDRYPDDCPLVRKARGEGLTITGAEGTEAQIREYMKDPDKLWQAIDDLDKDMGVLTDRLETAINDLTKGPRDTTAHKVVSLYEDRVSRWQKTVLIVTIIVGVLAFVGISLYDHRFDGLWNHARTTIEESP
jgi:hypothetical protein